MKQDAERKPVRNVSRAKRAAGWTAFTTHLPETLIRRVKIRAAERGMTMGDLVAEALDENLRKRWNDEDND